MIAPLSPDDVSDEPLAIETRGLSKRFRDAPPALDGLDMRVPTGSVYVLVGPNGAGKTTTLRILLDLIRADSGTARVAGIETTADPVGVRSRIGYVPEVVDTAYDWLRVRSLLHHRSVFYRDWDAAYASRLCARFHIRLDERWRNLSKGAARAVGIVAALAHRPPVLLLDEPTDGLDPLARETLTAAVVEHMTETPTTVLWSTHHVHEVERMADHLGVLHQGALILQASVGLVQQRIRRYRAEVHDGWSGVPGLNGQVLVRAKSGREITWTVVGEEREVAERLIASGARVRSADRLSLEESTLALLKAGRSR